MADITNSSILSLSALDSIPMAQNDSATSYKNFSITLLSSDLLKNDSDPNGASLKLTGVSNAVNGTVGLNSTGNIIFTPNYEFTGNAGFTYTVSNSYGATTTASVNVSVLNYTAGTTYYVSPTGNDKSAGTSPTQAWKTITKLNNINFKAGDRILFQGGATFSGNLSFNNRDVGTSAAPIIISSYGTGKAIINAGTGTGITAYNTGGYQISNLAIVGSGTGTNTGNGMNFYNDLANNTKLDYINISNVDVGGFKDSGIKIGSWNQNSGYRNVTVSNTIVHDNGISGLMTYAELPNSHENVNVDYVQAYNNFGTPGTWNGSGSGIVLGAVNTGKIEHSIAHDNGKLDDTGAGPVGIWTYDSNNMLIQYNESYNNRTGGTKDGGGFDFDQNVSNSIMQYNYSHGNDGAGYLLCQGVDNYSFTGNTVRYNISENDGRKNSYGGIYVYGRIVNTEVYNNTVFISPATTGNPKALKIENTAAATLDVSSLHLRNNIFQTTNGVQLVEVTAGQLNGSKDLLFQGNDYYSTGGAFKITWGSTTYDSLTNWQAATNQEKVSSQNVGLSVAPGLLNAGGGTTINNTYNLASLDAYKLGSTSPLINAGLNLNSNFGINTGLNDFYSSALPQGTGYDIGANEWK
ncbi:Ig-like domain-containing protein [Gloeothece verrucosa]|uniref:PA14 domain-containing protein n=1 Tax=Gloeothece verrucosa (strain PCC 7822) TaxID=497965 RepID=E0UL13_GLOV7|nr:cadherin-like domain-containing protein [Gloeothece verrucosa]ADN17643.1 PA14 domain-containing protein [Gloeothece verrucosa PCC 7822]